MTTKSTAPILWPQVWGLSTIQGAVILTWVIYNLYLPGLLGQFGIPATVATVLLLVENLLGAVMEPVMGSLSDRAQRWIGTRFPMIAAGVILSATCFIAIPAIALWSNPSRAGQQLLLLMLVTWALAMTVFRSPALSLLGRYAYGSGLPQAASILTLVGAVAGATAPLANQWILSLGAPVAFGMGSAVLLGAAFALRAVQPPKSPSERGMLPDRASVSIPRLALIFATGTGVAIGFRCMMQTLPLVVQKLPGANANLFLGLIFVAIALTALPAGKLAARMGNRNAMLLGLGVLAIALLLLLVATHGVAVGLLAIALGAAFSLVSNGTLPYALSLVPPAKAGLGTGMYFSGGAIGLSLFFSLVNAGSVVAGAVIGAIGFVVAGVSIAVSYRSLS